jgi:hypothetical protein
MLKGKDFSTIIFETFAFYGLDMELNRNRNRNRNRNLSKVGTGTRTVKNSYGSTTLVHTPAFDDSPVPLRLCSHHRLN